jgi:hypothetical protein
MVAYFSERITVGDSPENASYGKFVEGLFRDEW